MNRISVLPIAILVLLGAAPPLMAQVPDLHPIDARPTIQLANAPRNPNSPTGILPAQFKAAYGFNRIPNQGQGQTIALVDAYDDPTIASDLAFYATYFHLTPCNFQKVMVGNPAQGQGWDLQESLDVEQACALAPRANIILVEANSSSFADLLNAVAVASTAPYNATVISISWGSGEFSGEQQYDSYFCNVIAGKDQPVTFVASTNEASYPATSPCVIAAGGTTLILSTAAPPSNPLQLNYGTETAYGIGGISAFESQPPWQNPACSQFSTTGRCVPDIASDANPSTGVPVYDTYSENGWVEVGGTSLSTPDWASFFTIVNSLRANQSKGTLSQAGPDLYAIYDSSNYHSHFHDITSGSGAGLGYDLATGIGSYQANDLAPALGAEPN
jgi:subtilase family serine protease